MSSSEKDEAPPSPPRPPALVVGGSPRRSSVTLTPTWRNHKVASLLDSADENQEAHVMAFFPISTSGTPSSPALFRRPSSPSKEADLATVVLPSPRSPGSRNSVIFGSFRRKSLSKMGGAAAESDVDDALTTDDDDTGSSIDSADLKDLAADFWHDVPEAPADAILGIAQAYRVSGHPRKVNVCIGAYRDENGKPWVLPSVREAERILLDDPLSNKEYLPIEGDREFVELAVKFAYGQDMPMAHVAGVQTLSGTGACRIGGAFLNLFWPNHPIYVPSPTWGNHITIFKECGLDVRKYRYYNRATNGLDLRGMLSDIKKTPKGSIILLHACAHNPTGSDPTIDQWKKILTVIQQKEHVAFFDSAYQGFASGDAEEDAQPFRYAVSQQVPILLAQSFAKNFGLYGERCGTLSVVCGDQEQKDHILSELRAIIRPMYSSPPCHGSSIVKTVLKSDSLRPQYYQECAQMSARIQKMRGRLLEELAKAGSQHDWSHVLKQIGMFAFTGLTVEMSLQLTSEYAIFLTTNGRISIAGLNESNVEYVAKCIHEVTDGKSITGEA